MHRTGFDEPALSPGPLVGSYPTFSPLPIATPEIRDRRSVFCATFRRLSPPLSRERPALRCPDFPRARSVARESPRSPGLRLGLYRGFFACHAPVQAHPALRAPHVRPVVEDELAAYRALERRPAQHREKLLLERPVEGRHPVHRTSRFIARGTPPPPCRGSGRSRRRSARACCSQAGDGCGRSRGRNA